MRLFTLLLALAAMAATSSAQLPAPKPPQPPVGVPSDAKPFNGKWYRVYLEKGGWRHAKEKCATLGGQLVVIPDAPTEAYVKDLAGKIPLWIGATDEKLRAVWIWIDGTPVTYTDWEKGQPNGAPKENYMAIWHGQWNDAFENEPKVVGFICEWRGK